MSEDSAESAAPLQSEESKAAVSNGTVVKTSSNGDVPSTSSMEEEWKVNVVWGKEKFSLSVSPELKVSDFRIMLKDKTGVPETMQKLMCRGLMTDDKTLREARASNNCKIILMGSTKADVQAANVVPTKEELARDEAAKPKKEPLCKQEPHKKVIEKGVPDDAYPGILNAQEALPHIPISGMVDKKGTKVRLTFKLEADELWIGTKERTQKVQMTNISSVVSEPIEGHEQYHMLGIQTGSTELSRVWFYWVPAQFVPAIKNAILGTPLGR